MRGRGLLGRGWRQSRLDAVNRLGRASINFEHCRSLWNAVDQFQASPIKFGHCESSRVHINRLEVLSVARFGARYIYSNKSPIFAILIPASFNVVEIFFAKSKAFSLSSLIQTVSAC